jgi:trk system potassium uptake protein
MEKLGVTETVFPERDSAVRLATRISSTTILNVVRLGTHFSIQELAVPDDWTGESLRDLRLPDRFGVSVIAVHDNLTDDIVVVPNADAPLKDSDTLIVAGSDENLEKLLQKR